MATRRQHPAMSGRTAERNRSTQMTGPWGRADTMPSAGVGSTSFEAVVEASGATAGGANTAGMTATYQLELAQPTTLPVADIA